MEATTRGTKQESNAYELFILVLTVLSLAIMVALVLPGLSQGTEHLLEVYDNVICFVFLFDFACVCRGQSTSATTSWASGGGWI